MALYKRFPLLVTIWAFVEVVCFAGVLFGWGSLVYILKEEGFYIDACDTGTDERLQKIVVDSSNVLNKSVQHLTNSSYSLLPNTNGNEKTSKSLVFTLPSDVASTRPPDDYIDRGCQAQESKLNLWFSIAVSFMYLSFTGIGYLNSRFGTRIIRIAAIVIYMTGTLCLAFANPEIPWLLLPGLCCIGTAGLGLLSTNLQVANLQPRFRSTIIGIFTGLFDLSSGNKQLIKVAYESGIPRRTSYIFITIVYMVVVTTSTLFFLPKRHIAGVVEDRVKQRSKSEGDNTPDVEHSGANEELLHDNGEKEVEALGNCETTTKEAAPSLCSIILSLTCLFHLVFIFVHALRFVTFIGFLNVWLETVYSGDESKVGSMLGVFSVMTMGAIGSALLTGFVYDWQRRRHAESGTIKRVYVPVVLPMFMVIFYSTFVTVMCQIENPVTPYLAFAGFTMFRSAFFTVVVAFFGNAYPVEHFAVLFGLIQCSAGVAGLMQYPLFEWYKAYDGSYNHVNILLLILQLATVLHPVILWLRGNRDTSKGSPRSLKKELLIEGNDKETEAEKGV